MSSIVEYGVFGKIILDTILMLGFVLTLFLSVGSNYLSVLSETIGIRLNSEPHKKVGRIYSRLGLINSVLSLSFFIVLFFLNTIFTPAAISLAFNARFFLTPLTIILVSLILQCTLMTVYHRGWGLHAHKSVQRLLLGVTSSTFATLAVSTFVLVISFMIAPNVPTGLLVILNPERFGSLQLLSLMYNVGWLPALFKALFVGTLSAALLVASMSVLIARKARGGPSQQEWSFNTRWSYKLAFLFGAPITLIGFWNAAAFHTSIPTIAIGLMGVIKEEVPPATAALVGDLGYLWHVGIVSAVILAAFAVVFYWNSKKIGEGTQTIDTSALKMLVRLAIVFWLIDIISASVSSLIIPRHSTLIVYVIIGGLVTIQSLRLYSQGKVGSNMPVAFFTFACAFILMYIGQYNQWFLAYKYGGVPWPPVAFIVSLPVAMVMSRLSKMQKYVLPLVSGFLPPLIIVCKGLLHELVRGNSSVVVDPTYRPVLAEWSRATGIDPTPVFAEYATLASSQILVATIIAFMIFVGIFLYCFRSVKIIPYAELKVEPLIRKKKELKLSRRSVFQFLILVSGISTLSTLIPYGRYFSEGPQPRISRTKIANISELPLNSSKVFLWPTEIRPFDTNILIRDESGKLYAYNRVCTHLQCLVNYDPVTKQIVCPCHASRYSSETGNVINGPAANALPLIEIEQDARGDIYALDIKGRFGYGR